MKKRTRHKQQDSGSVSFWVREEFPINLPAGRQGHKGRKAFIISLIFSEFLMPLWETKLKLYYYQDSGHKPKQGNPSFVLPVT
jgi:hypothetical protein